jgi:hypothetical protein
VSGTNQSLGFELVLRPESGAKFARVKVELLPSTSQFPGFNSTVYDDSSKCLSKRRLSLAWRFDTTRFSDGVALQVKVSWQILGSSLWFTKSTYTEVWNKFNANQARELAVKYGYGGYLYCDYDLNVYPHIRTWSANSLGDTAYSTGGIQTSDFSFTQAFNSIKQATV